jgi:hypothetical protein
MVEIQGPALHVAELEATTGWGAEAGTPVADVMRPVVWPSDLSLREPSLTTA